VKVAGFSFIRNAVKYGYPITEALSSILDLCEVIYVAVGESDDDTLEIVKSLNPQKIKVINTVWDSTLIEGGKVLADETNKALKSIPMEYDWCIYIQGDEVLHEKDHPNIRNAMETYMGDEEVDGLLFDYLHFYGSFDYVARATDWYRREIRVIKNNRNIYSYRDAQGFRKENNEKLKVKKCHATVYHYGWVRPPQTMLDKIEAFHQLYGIDREIPQSHEGFDYGNVNLLQRFTQTHPKYIQSRIDDKNWNFEQDISINKLSIIEKMRLYIEEKTGYIPGEYRNYRLLK